MAWVAARVWQNPNLVPKRAQRAAGAQLVRGMIDSVPIVILIASLLGGMYVGVVTPTEAAGFGCLVALVIAGLLSVSFNWPSMRDALRNAVVTNAVVMFVIVNAQILNYALTTSGIGHGVSEALVHLGLGQFGFFVVLVLLYLLLGMFIDGISMMLLTVPLLYPTLQSYGFNGVLFGVILVVLIELGQLTPPMGLNLFAIQSISGGVRLGRIATASAPFAVLVVVLCFLVYFVPSLALWLPAYMKN